jgi:hypothetical protein
VERAAPVPCDSRLQPGFVSPFRGASPRHHATLPYPSAAGRKRLCEAIGVPGQVLRTRVGRPSREGGRDSRTGVRRPLRIGRGPLSAHCCSSAASGRASARRGGRGRKRERDAPKPTGASRLQSSSGQRPKNNMSARSGSARKLRNGRRPRNASACRQSANRSAPSGSTTKHSNAPRTPRSSAQQRSSRPHARVKSTPTTKTGTSRGGKALPQTPAPTVTRQTVRAAVEPARNQASRQRHSATVTLR